MASNNEYEQQQFWEVKYDYIWINGELKLIDSRAANETILNLIKLIENGYNNPN